MGDRIVICSQVTILSNGKTFINLKLLCSTARISFWRRCRGNLLRFLCCVWRLCLDYPFFSKFIFLKFKNPKIFFFLKKILKSKNILLYTLICLFLSLALYLFNSSLCLHLTYTVVNGVGVPQMVEIAPVVAL